MLSLLCFPTLFLPSLKAQQYNSVNEQDTLWWSSC